MNANSKRATALLVLGFLGVLNPAHAGQILPVGVTFHRDTLRKLLTMTTTDMWPLIVTG